MQKERCIQTGTAPFIGTLQVKQFCLHRFKTSFKYIFIIVLNNVIFLLLLGSLKAFLPFEIGIIIPCFMH